MELHFVTFAGIGSLSSENRDYRIWKSHRNYKAEAIRLIDSAQKVGIKNVTLLDWEWLIETQAYKDNPQTFAKPPYFWAFKPLAIWEMLQPMNYGDVLIYADSNHVFSQYPSSLINGAKQHHIYTYDHRPAIYQNFIWTRKDTFVKMGCDEEKYWYASQYHANVIGVHKDDFSVDFIEEWKNCSINYDIVRGNNSFPDFKKFVEDRGDQSVFTLLALKRGVPAQTKPDDVISEGSIIRL